MVRECFFALVIFFLGCLMVGAVVFDLPIGRSWNWGHWVAGIFWLASGLALARCGAVLLWLILELGSDKPE